MKGSLLRFAYQIMYGMCQRALLSKVGQLKEPAFGNDKAPQSIYGQNIHYKSIFLEFNRRLVNMLIYFPKGADNYTRYNYKRHALSSQSMWKFKAVLKSCVGSVCTKDE